MFPKADQKEREKYPGKAKDPVREKDQEKPKRREAEGKERKAKSRHFSGHVPYTARLPPEKRRQAAV